MKSRVHLKHGGKWYNILFLSSCFVHENQQFSFKFSYQLKMILGSFVALQRLMEVLALVTLSMSSLGRR